MSTEKMQLVNGKISLIILMLVGGIVIIYLANFVAFPYLPQRDFDYFEGEFEYNDNIGVVSIRFHASSGLLPSRGIEPYIMVEFYENQINSSKVTMEFPEAMIMNVDDIPQTLRQGKDVRFKFKESNDNGSVYDAKPFMLYNRAGPIDVYLFIDDNETKFEEQFESISSIDTWDYFVARQREIEFQRIQWSAIGIAVFAAAPAVAKILDIVYERLVLKRDLLYENYYPKGIKNWFRSNFKRKNEDFKKKSNPIN